MDVLIIFFSPILFLFLFVFMDALIQTLQEESLQVKPVPPTKSDWKEEQARAIAYSKGVVIQTPRIDEPTSEVSYHPIVTDQTNHYEYLRSACRDSYDFLNNQLYQLTLMMEGEAHLLSLTHQGQKVACAKLKGLQIIQIDYGSYAPSERHTVRHYFEQVKEAIDFAHWVNDADCQLQTHHLKTHVREKQEYYKNQQRSILQTYDHLLVLLDELDEKEEQLSLEWQHKTSHHFREPITQMLERYNQLSQEEKNNTHETFCLLLEETVELLKEQTQKMNRKETETLLRDMALLKKRLQVN